MSFWEKDIFCYKNRAFSLPENHDPSELDLIWVLGLYTKKPEPVGYVLLNPKNMLE